MFPWDESYLATKCIMQGKTSMNPEFEPLADFIAHNFGVRPVNIHYEPTPFSNSFRLGIYLERVAEKKTFRDHNNPLDSDPEKTRRILRAFRQSIRKQGLARPTGLRKLFDHDQRGGYFVNHTWVCYLSFEEPARIEANMAIPKEELLSLTQELGADLIFTIDRFYEQTTFFVYTNAQLNRCRESDIEEKWTYRYLELLEAHDEFGYFNADNFRIRLDSKENLDTIYEGSLHNYYR